MLGVCAELAFVAVGALAVCVANIFAAIAVSVTRGSGVGAFAVCVAKMLPAMRVSVAGASAVGAANGKAAHPARENNVSNKRN